MAKDINTPTLETKRLILRKFAHEDLEAFYKIMSDAKANEFLPWLVVTSMEEAALMLNHKFLEFYELDFSMRYVICRKEDHIPIGYVWLSNEASHDFGYGLRSEFWNQGIVTESAREVLSVLKGTHLDFITATHDIYNPASGKVMQKLGMSYQYSYVEQWMPKNKTVTFRLYQLNFSQDDLFVYNGYRKKYSNSFIEKI